MWLVTRTWLPLVWLLGACATLFSMVAPWMAGRLVYLFSLPTLPTRAQVNTAVGLSLGALLVSALLRAMNSLIQARMTEAATRDLTLRIYRHLLHVSPLFFRNREVERINSRALGDTGTVVEFWISVLSGIPLAVVALVAYGAVMLWINPLLGGCAMVLSLLSGYFLLLDQQIKTTHRRALEASDRIRVSAGELIGGVEEIRNHGIHAHAMRDLEQRFEENRRVALDMARLKAIFAGSGPMIAALQNGTIEWLGALIAAGLCAPWFGRATWGSVTTFSWILILFQAPVRTLAGSLLDWRMSQESIRRVNEYLEQPATFRVEPGAPDVEEALPIRIDHVDLVAPGGMRILSGVDLDLQGGQHVAMVGPAGSGKSSTIQLLARHWEPTQGSILLGDRNAATYNLESFTRTFGFVPQKAIVFNTSIRNNLLLGLRRPSGRGLEDALGWIDTSHWPEVRDMAALDRRLVEAIRVVGLEADLFRKALDTPCPPLRAALLEPSCGVLRSRIAGRCDLAPPRFQPFSEAELFPGSLEENLIGPNPQPEATEELREQLLEAGRPWLEDLLALGRHRVSAGGPEASRLRTQTVEWTDVLLARPNTALPQDFKDLRRYMDGPAFTLPRALPGIKIVPPVALHFRNVRRDFFSRFHQLQIGEAQPGKLLAGIAQLPVGRFVELLEPRRLRINYHHAIGRLLEQQPVAGFGGAQCVPLLFQLVLRRVGAHQRLV